MAYDAISRRSSVKASATATGAALALFAAAAAQEAGANPLTTEHGKLRYQEESRMRPMAWWRNGRATT